MLSPCSTMLEWTIIVLIFAEIVVGVCDLFDVRPFSKAARSVAAGLKELREED